MEEQNARLEEQNARLVERIQTLEHRLGLHSRNSGKPPSSDGLKKPKAPPRTGSLRDRSERKPGGHPGHKGSTLRRTEHPARVEDHVPAACEGCGSSLSDAAAAGTPSGRTADRPREAASHMEDMAAYRVRARRGDLLDLLPKGVIAFPCSGTTDNLVDKARALGIPVQRCA